MFLRPFEGSQCTLKISITNFLNVNIGEGPVCEGHQANVKPCSHVTVFFFYKKLFVFLCQ